jgi:lysozyme family protein
LGGARRFARAVKFEEAFDRLIGHEGGYTEGKDDPGGETKFGISKRSYPDLDIRNLTLEDARAIYLRDFWNVIDGADTFEGSLMFQVFDMAVNSGPGNAIRCLQQVANVAPDGHFGPVSREALYAISENDSLMLFIAYRQKFQTKLKNWPAAGKGWANRNANNLILAAGDNRE